MKSTYRKQKGFTLTEILIALAVLAFAFVPLMGVMWSGVRRTDVSAAYENAGNIGASILEFMLADSVRFSDIDFTNPAAAGLRAPDNGASGTPVKESSGILSTSPLFADNNRINDFLGEACSTHDGDGLCTIPSSKARYFKIARTNFYSDMYIGAYYKEVPGAGGVKTDMEYRYLRNPVIDYESYTDAGSAIPQRFYDTMILDGTMGFSPYDPVRGWSLVPGTYESDPKEDIQLSLEIAGDPINVATGSSVDGAKYANFSKIQLFIRWGFNWLNRIKNPVAAGDRVMTTRQIDSRGRAKMIELITFKGRFE